MRAGPARTLMSFKEQISYIAATLASKRLVLRLDQNCHSDSITSSM